MFPFQSPAHTPSVSPVQQASQSPSINFHCRDISDEFIFRSEHGILSNWYPSCELMPFKGSAPFPYNKDHTKLPIITLREAALTGINKLKCICKKGFKDKHCACRAAGFNCNSHRHPKSKSCTNQMESNCTINRHNKTWTINH